MCDIYIKRIMFYFCVLNHRKKGDKQVVEVLNVITVLNVIKS